MPNPYDQWEEQSEVIDEYRRAEGLLPQTAHRAEDYLPRPTSLSAPLARKPSIVKLKPPVIPQLEQDQLISLPEYASW